MTSIESRCHSRKIFMVFAVIVTWGSNENIARRSECLRGLLQVLTSSSFSFLERLKHNLFAQKGVEIYDAFACIMGVKGSQIHQFRL